MCSELAQSEETPVEPEETTPHWQLLVGNAVIDMAAGTVLQNERRVFLTSLEHRLLVYLVEHLGVPVDNSEIARAVWNCDFGDGERSALKSLVYRLRQKIEPNPARPEYLVTVRGRGLVLIGVQRGQQP